VPGICDKDGTPLVRRDDDAAEVVRARLEKQVPPMLEVVEHYRNAGVLTEVDGRRPIDVVQADILAAVA
jgi:adenylate kinase